MVWIPCFVLLVVTFVVAVVSEGISHSSHMMLKAAENGDTNTVIDYITKTGVPINVKNNYGVSAIIFAANNGHRDLLEALVDVGANFEDRSNNWKTPLNWAAYWGHYDCVKYLVGIGANIATYDTKGMTPLMAATFNSHAKVVQFLLDSGADPLAKNIFNGTALSIARVQNNTELISLLEPYYPEEGPSSPYIIMYHIILVELGKLGEVLQRETSRYYTEFLVHAAAVREELTKRWEEFNTPAPSTAHDPQPHSGSATINGGQCTEGQGGCSYATSGAASQDAHEEF